MSRQLRDLYKKKSDDELILILKQSQSYQPDAVELAKKILSGRGILEEEIDEWRDPSAKFSIDNWHRSLSPSAFRQKLKRRQHLYFTILCIFFIWDSCKVLTYDTEGGYIIAMVMFLVLFTYSYLINVLLRSLAWGVMWKSPIRILLLRPFRFPHNKKQIKHIVKQYLRYSGHIYTISDSEIKSRGVFEGLLGLTFILSGSIYIFFVKTSFKIQDFYDVQKLRVSIGRRFVRNVIWALSFDKIFKISCMPETWQITVQNLINIMQVVIVDLSDVKEGLKWELGELEFYDSLDKVVIIAHKDYADSVRNFLESSVLFKSGKEVFLYGNDGIISNHEDFMDAIVTAANNSIVKATQSDKAMT